MPVIQKVCCFLRILNILYVFHCRPYLVVFVIRDELEDEYEEMKNETIDQLKEVKMSLDKMEKGDVSLVDNVNAMQLVSFLFIK